MNNGCKLALALVPLILLLTACFGDPQNSAAAPAVYVVDVDKVLTASNAAEAGRAHLAQARAALEKGYADLSRAWEKQPEAERARVLAEGARALSRQMSIEQQAVTGVVAALMLEEVKKWRAANKAGLVVARSGVLDAEPDADITAAIIAAMNTRSPEFAALPVVNVTRPTPQGAAKRELRPAEKPEPAKAPARERAGRNGTQEKRR